MSAIGFIPGPGEKLQIDLYIQEIETTHKLGPDGVLIPVDVITFGKKGTTNYQKVWQVPHLMKQDRQLWELAEPIYEKWKKTNTIATTGTPVETWPVLSKPQLKLCKELGLHSVEDIAAATDATREKLRMGGLELIKAARAFIENADRSAAANRVSALEDQLAEMQRQNAEAREIIDKLMAEKGQRPQNPVFKEKAA